MSETTYASEQGADLPARVYRVERGQERYSATVVDYRQLQTVYSNLFPAPPRTRGGQGGASGAGNPAGGIR